MKFRPCIDIHNGKVKQIVGGSLKDSAVGTKENFVSEQGAAFYATFYKERNIEGGHIILLNPAGTKEYEEDVKQAKEALAEYPNSLQIGGGITSDNAKLFLEAGASHVIVTSYVFRDGIVDYERIQKLVDTVGKEHLVLDLSCRKKDNAYYIVTDRWQQFTKEKLTPELLDQLAGYCDEFLVHAVDVEGKANGIEEDLADMLGQWSGIPITYAGGVGNYEDISLLKTLGKGHIDVTVGSALDLFGGPLEFDKVLKYINN